MSSKSCSPFGTKKFQGRNFSVPAEEFEISYGGNFWESRSATSPPPGGAVRKPYKQVAPLGANQAGLLGVLDFYGETKAIGSGLAVWCYYSIAIERRAFC